jgi:hypothetical protein
MGFILRVVQDGGRSARKHSEQDVHHSGVHQNNFGIYETQQEHTMFTETAANVVWIITELFGQVFTGNHLGF